MSHYTVACPACCFSAMPGPYSLNICPLSHRVLIVVPLISSVGIKSHHSAALPTPHQLSTSPFPSFLDWAWFPYCQFLVCFFLFVCFFVVVSFWFGLMLFVQGFFPPEIPIFSPDFALLVFLLPWYLDSITPACALALYPLQLLFRYLGLDRWRSFSGTHVTCSIN